MAFFFAWSGVVQVPAVIFGRDLSLRIGIRLVMGEGGESQPDRSIRTVGGVVVSSITGGFGGRGGLVSRRGSVSRSGASFRTACGVSGVLVCTIGEGLEGAGALVSCCDVTGIVPIHGEFLHFWREWYQSRSRFLFRCIASASLSVLHSLILSLSILYY